jgi:hypothetical protein
MHCLQLRFLSTVFTLGIVAAFRLETHQQAPLSVEVARNAHNQSCVEALRMNIRTLTVKEMFGAASEWAEPGWWRFQSKESAYSEQWKKAAGNLTVWARPECNKTLKWGQLLNEESYAYERSRLIALGRLSETDGHIVNESTVRGVCDLSPITLRFLIRNKQLLEHMWIGLSGDIGLNASLEELSASLREAIERECFNDCFETVSSEMKSYSCEQVISSVAGNATQCAPFFEGVIDKSRQCLELPSDSLELVTDVAAGKTCQVFHRPSVLWEPSDKGAGALSPGGMNVAWMINGMLVYRALLDYGNPILNVVASSIPWIATGANGRAWLDRQGHAIGAVCTLPPEHANTGDKKHIEQTGMCPEGTKCKCPMTRLRARESTSEIRKDGLDVFLRHGVSEVALFKAQVKNVLLVTAVKASLASGLAGGAQAVLATISAPTFLYLGVKLVVFGGFLEYVSHRCASTIGCWPQQPDSVSVNGTWSACRPPAKAREGGSPVWFLPPPGLRLKHSKGWCVLDQCKQSDREAQTVGLVSDPKEKRAGKPYIYNCQPLAFEAMSPDQREVFIERLAESGLEDEYDLSEARRYPNDEI